LQPTDLEKYKSVFLKYQERDRETEKESRSFQKRILGNRKAKGKPAKIGIEAKRYFDFWRVVDEVGLLSIGV